MLKNELMTFVKESYDGLLKKNEILMDYHFFYIVEVGCIINQLKELRYIS